MAHACVSMWGFSKSNFTLFGIFFSRLDPEFLFSAGSCGGQYLIMYILQYEIEHLEGDISCYGIDF